ncbi:AfsR/SARP family transcriptional regulator [Desulfonatronum thioautotrophicum]|uniref:AfsR/SARP family transcriptional regulator n=1 Tax=Desulfonatronum thioautotrophicum TaxID=617001 RepID=UPI0005EB0A45|nr:BTAD domain-containing putative transcriptional regulator [Desulfonatronum thioautotrophicum]
MGTFSIKSLTSPFRACFLHGRWDYYVKLLEDKGAIWILEYDIEKLKKHVMPLLQFDIGVDCTSRFLFFVDITKNNMTIDKINNYFKIFYDSKDCYYSAASVNISMMLALNKIPLSNLIECDKQIDKILKIKNFSDIVSSNLWIQKALIYLIIKNDFKSALKFVYHGEKNAKKSSILNLLCLSKSTYGHIMKNSGNFGIVKKIIHEFIAYSEKCQNSSVVFLNMKFFIGFFCYFDGRYLEAETIFQDILDDPMCKNMQHFEQLEIKGMLLMTVFELGKREEVLKLTEEIQYQLGSFESHYVLAWAHYWLAVSALLSKNTQDALLNGKEGIEQGSLCAAPIPMGQNALLVAQAMVDLGQVDDAEAFLHHWIDYWTRTNFYYLAACGLMEMSSLQLWRGMFAQAEETYTLGLKFSPEGESLRVLHRPPGFVKNLRKRLEQSQKEIASWLDSNDVIIRVYTLGKFEITVGKRLMFDRYWRGVRTKRLLQSLIVHGGTKVSKHILMDLLWPDKDGDLAANNLKMALSRLRRAVNEVYGSYLNWLFVSDGCVSMVRSLCFVDCLAFRERLHAAMCKECRTEELTKALDGYTGDFIPGNLDEVWINEYRQQLRKDYVQGVIFLANHCLHFGDVKTSLEYLLRIQDWPMISEQVYALLMQSYVNLGYPSDALRIFRHARFRLKEEFDTLPGTTLLSLARQAREAS